jgi:hypothetical protein
MKVLLSRVSCVAMLAVMFAVLVTPAQPAPTPISPAMGPLTAWFSCTGLCNNSICGPGGHCRNDAVYVYNCALTGGKGETHCIDAVCHR